MLFWQIDAFTKTPFSGNPAAVVLVKKNLTDEYMQSLASEMNLSETAFIDTRNTNPLIRWFTPKSEVDLCGHATLSAAHVYFNEVNKESAEVTFDTKFVGTLKVKKNKNLSYSMAFPTRPGQRIPVESIPPVTLSSISPDKKPLDAYLSRDLMLVYESEDIIKDLKPNFSQLHTYDHWVIVTAKSKKYDFVSRFFCAGDGIDEDPVTGSAHCTLAPYWANQLKKTQLTARQISKRGGDLLLDLVDDKVLITGDAITVFQGKIL